MEETAHWNRPAKAGDNYQRTKMQKEMILQKLKSMGCRITKQRQILLNIILREECASCKEIYYKAKKEDAKIGAATVYRMINLMEEIGAISRKNMYIIPGPAPAGTDSGECPDGGRIPASMQQGEEMVCIIEFDDHTYCRLSDGEWNRVMTEGLRACGCMKGQNIVNIFLSSYPGMKEQGKTGTADPVIERFSQQGKTDGK